LVLDTEFSSTDAPEKLLENLKALATEVQSSDLFIELGRTTLCRIVAAYPDLMPYVHRDLFWFFAGDCLHFMPDDEISRYQQLEELRYEAEQLNSDLNPDTHSEFNYAEERAKVFGLQ
jgi:hypothetical protein